MKKLQKMSYPKIVMVPLAAAIALATSFQSGGADTKRSEDAVAVVVVPKPREAALLQLRGYAGRGTIHFRIDGTCEAMPTRFVAGDFGGDRIGSSRAGPIQLRVVNPRNVMALYKGRDIVSDMVEVSINSANQADVVIDAGLSAETGFVINPGGGVIADIVGPARSLERCDIVERAMANE